MQGVLRTSRDGEEGGGGSEGGEDAERGGRVTVYVICNEKGSQMS